MEKIKNPTFFFTKTEKIHPGFIRIFMDYWLHFIIFLWNSPFHLFHFKKIEPFSSLIFINHNHHHHHVMDYSLIMPLQLFLFSQPYWLWNYFDCSLIFSHPFWKKLSNFSPLPHQSLFAPVCTLCCKMVCSLCKTTVPKPSSQISTNHRISIYQQ